MADVAETLTHLMPTGRPARIVTWAAFQRLVDELVGKVVDFRPDLVVGILQGGWVVAQALGDQLPDVVTTMIGGDLDHGFQLLAADDGILRPGPAPAGARILLVDEVVDSGRTAGYFTEKLVAEGAAAVATACLFSTQDGRPGAQFAARRFDHLPNLVFPWRVLRDLQATMDCLLAAGPQTVPELRSRLADLGFTRVHGLEKGLEKLRSRGLLQCDGERWALTRQAPSRPGQRDQV
jgi:hypoxanthine phosphoribosyltransferase